MLSITLVMFVVAALTVAAQGQKPPDPKAQDPNAQVVETRPETARGEADLKPAPRVNTRDKQVRQAPPHKGGEQPRGGQGTCDVHFDNRTPWWIHLWVDGEYEGLMPPWGDVYTWAIAGRTRLAGRADFDSGASLTWATTVNCPAGGIYNWRLLQR
jgi:hypothetical protein